MAVSSKFPHFLLPLLLTSCAGDTGMQNALKPDPLLTASPTPTTQTPTAQTPTAQTPTPASPNPSPVAPTFSPTPSPTAPSSSESNWPDLDQTPSNLRPYIKDLLALNLLNPEAKPDAKSTPLAPRLNSPIDRRTVARWLLTINNRFYDTSKQIRTAETSAKPVFQDIPTTDPDFATIQGLAEAGIIPSALTHSAGSDRFYPEKPITREDLLRWKVPLDARVALPPATIADIRKAWAFQDTDQINPVALPALYHDHQNGDASNLRRTFGYTTLLQPKRAVTHAEAAAVLWSIGFQSDRITAQDLLKNRP